MLGACTNILHLDNLAFISDLFYFKRGELKVLQVLDVISLIKDLRKANSELIAYSIVNSMEVKLVGFYMNNETYILLQTPHKDKVPAELGYFDTKIKDYKSYMELNMRYSKAYYLKYGSYQVMPLINTDLRCSELKRFNMIALYVCKLIKTNFRKTKVKILIDMNNIFSQPVWLNFKDIRVITDFSKDTGLFSYYIGINYNKEFRTMKIFLHGNVDKALRFLVELVGSAPTQEELNHILNCITPISMLRR